MGAHPERKNIHARVAMTGRLLAPVCVAVLVAVLALACGCGSPAVRQKTSSVHWLELERVKNARDLGGWKLKDGTVVPYGRVFRTGRISEASPGDVNTLRRLGLRTTIDLRTDEEIRKNGTDETAVGGFARTVRVPMKAAASAEGYADIVGSQKSAVAAVFRTLADGSAYPFLFHCNAGKDRTGVVSALLLELLGVPRQEIVEDYLLSADAGLKVDEEWLDAVFRAVDAAGGIQNYLSGIGIDASMQNAIRQAVLKPEIPST
ncbi:MAG: tyrosine-protein phosphatase [Candidatus Geothermincolia bacterium]